MIYLARCSHYEVLGVAHRATVADIEAAHARRMSELPSSSLLRFVVQALTGRSEASLLAAKTVLSDPLRRSDYDASLLSPYFWISVV